MSDEPVVLSPEYTTTRPVFTCGHDASEIFVADTGKCWFTYCRICRAEGKDGPCPDADGKAGHGGVASAFFPGQPSRHICMTCSRPIAFLEPPLPVVAHDFGRMMRIDGQLTLEPDEEEVLGRLLVSVHERGIKKGLAAAVSPGCRTGHACSCCSRTKGLNVKEVAGG